MFSKLYKFSKFVMYLNSCSMDLGRDSVSLMLEKGFIYVTTQGKSASHICAIPQKD